MGVASCFASSPRCPVYPNLASGRGHAGRPWPAARIASVRLRFPSSSVPSTYAEESTMKDDHRIQPVLDKLSQARGAEANSKPKSEKGRGQEFPHHEHGAVTHTHGHSHVVHYRKPGERD